MVSGRGLSALTSCAYVGSIYIFPGGRANRRDDLDVMIRRVLGILLLTIFSVMNFGKDYWQWAFTFNHKIVNNTVRALIVLHFVYLPQALFFGLPKIKWANKQQKLMTLRDLVIGPLSEEFVYRGVIPAIYEEAGFSQRVVLQENFWYFGIAHLHHALMNWLGEVVSARIAFLQGTVQFVMTSLFGTYACYLTIRTGTIWPAVVSHLVCNFYGPPRLDGPLTYKLLTLVGVAMWGYSITLF